MKKKKIIKTAFLIRNGLDWDYSCDDTGFTW